MSTATKPVLLLGAGKIGFAIALMLERSGDYSVLVADQDPARLAAVAELGCETRLIPDDDAGARHRRPPCGAQRLAFHRAIAVAGLCAKAGVHYFDLTEDVASTHAIQALAADARSVLMPQCGLAPGFIGIVGNALARRFDAAGPAHARGRAAALSVQQPALQPDVEHGRADQRILQSLRGHRRRPAQQRARAGRL